MKGIIILLGFLVFAQSEDSPLDPCHTLDGSSTLILALNESLGEDYSQSPVPKELPLYGDIGSDISLEISEDDSGLFKLQDKQLHLIAPLDRDANDLSSLSLKITCESLSDGRRRTIPLLVRVLDLNDNAPLFKGTPYSINLPENTPVNSVVFSQLSSMDADANINGQVQYHIADEDSPFAIESPYQGIITLVKPLDYEKVQRYFVQIVATDRAEMDRLSSTTTLTLKVQDSDDLPPKFLHGEEYSAEVISGYPVSNLRIRPEKIHAEDQDSLRTKVTYSLARGSPPNFDVYFGIDPDTGVISQRQVVDKSKYRVFEITVKATETSGRSAEAQLIIKIIAEDKSPPQLAASSQSGFIDEGAQVGTYVTDSNGERISFSITDKDIANGNDLQPQERYDLEMTTDFFQIDKEGFLIVSKANIDRDPPYQSILSFQIFAREKFKSFKSSTPVLLKIYIRDINDNSPVFSPINDVTLTAGSNRRVVAQLNATDKDSDKFIQYKLLSVSNNGRQKFILDSKTGLLEVVAPILEGERYAITIQAVDNGGLSNMAVIRVNTIPMPNIHGPSFDRFLYDIAIDEDVPKFTSVVETKAVDPERSRISYSIIDGNDLNHFLIEESTGIVRVMSDLDRENITNYNLTIKAQDDGGKYATAALKITVLDVNDNTPLFQDLPLSFRVSEGAVREFVGDVSAVDDDAESNGEVSFFVNETEEHFSIEEKSGRIYTIDNLDFEEQSVHYLVIGAQDSGSPPRSASATATILIQDTSDEIPYFEIPYTNISIPENGEESLLTTVKAIDRDSEPSITYRIITGDKNRFRVDPSTGDVYVTQSLDYERGSYFSLMIGTEEGFFEGSLSGKSVTKIDVHVEDLNDVPPHFTKVPYGQTISIRNDLPIGRKIGSVAAADSSGSSPIDSIAFNISSDGSTQNADKFFSVHPLSGDILVSGNLTVDIREEYQLEIMAYSTSNPSLQSLILIRIIIKIVMNYYTEPGIGFEELNYEVEIKENIKKNSVIFSLPIARNVKKQQNVPFKCNIKSITSDNDTDLQSEFLSRVNENKECDIILNVDTIDREMNDHYDIVVELQSRPEFLDSLNSLAHISLKIRDENDHHPVFNKKRYFGIVKVESLPNTPILQVQALDKDFGPNGEIQYFFQDLNNSMQDIFQIDSETGIISSSVLLNEVKIDVTKPLQLRVIAEDQSPQANKRLMGHTDVIINILDVNANDLVLTLPKISPLQFESHRADLIDVLEESTGYKVGIDKVDTAMIKYLNGSCCTPLFGTDVYFHVIDPIQYRILNSTETKVKTHILNSAKSIKQRVSQRLKLGVSDLHLPYNEAVQPEEVVKKAGIGDDMFTYYSIVIGLAVGLFVLTAMAAVYLCCARRKLEMSMEKKEKMIVVPRYEPIFMDPPQKEYETQILQMNVPYASEDFKGPKTGPNIKETDSNEFSMDDDIFFDLDHIHYITKEESR